MSQYMNWICSFPRSGNTWVRFILGNLYFGDVTSSGDLETNVPDSHHVDMASMFQDLQAGKERLYLAKSHFPPVHFQSHSFNQRFIYIVRNPFDVLCSLANYYAGSLSVDEQTANDPAFKEQQLGLALDYVIHSLGSLPDQEIFGHWQNHTVEWAHRDHGLDFMMIRYEDLIANPVEEVVKMTLYLEQPKSPQDIAQALENASFQKLRRIEEKEAGTPKSWLAGNVSGLHFFNKGKVGNFRSVLTSQQIDTIWESCGPIAEYCGYRLEALLNGE